MSTPRPALRVLAVACSLAIFGGYVYYRASADRAANEELSEAAPVIHGSKSAPVFEPETQPGEPAETPATQASEVPAEFDLMMATSKSAGGGAVKPRDVAKPNAQRSQKAPATRPVEIMPGSKSVESVIPSSIFGDPTESKSPPATQPANPPNEARP